jgi:hypothetical protein
VHGRPAGDDLAVAAGDRESAILMKAQGGGNRRDFEEGRVSAIASQPIAHCRREPIGGTTGRDAEGFVPLPAGILDRGVSTRVDDLDHDR